MRRLFWVGVGVAIGVSATRRVSAVTQKATPAGVGASLGEGLRELGAGLGAFGAEVRAGMAEREDELATMVEDTTAIPVGASGPVAGRHTAGATGTDSAAPAGRHAGARGGRARARTAGH